MRLRWLLNLLMLVLVAGLGWWVYQETEPAGAGNRLAQVPAAGLRRIVIDRSGDQDIELARRETGWELLTPRRLPASAFHVQMIERFLASPVSARYRPEEVDLAAAGLQTPKLSLIVDAERLAFGGLEPLSQRRYLLYRGQVVLVQDGVSALLAAPWWNFIDRRLLASEAEVTALEFADGRRLDKKKAPRVLARWREVAATQVRPKRQDVQGEEFVLVLASGERQRWQWVADEQPRLLRPELGLAYHMSAETVAALLGQQ